MRAVDELVLEQAVPPFVGISGTNDGLTVRLGARSSNYVKLHIISSLAFSFASIGNSSFAVANPSESLLNGRLRRKRCR